MSESQGFGSGGGGARMPAQQDIVGVLKKPQTWIRIAAVIFSIIVFATIADRVTDFDGCAFNNKLSACNYGVAIGVIAFLVGLTFIVMDFAVLAVTRDDLRRYVIIADFVLSAALAFLWFVGFCFLTNEWRVTKLKGSTATRNAAQGAIAFCFFSIVAWVALAVFGFLAVRTEMSGGSGGYGGLGSGGGASAPLAQDKEGPYQEPPSSGDSEKPVY